MIKLTRAQLVEELAANGFSFARLELQTDSACTVEDALWNYRDLRHYNVVHAQDDGSRILYSPVSGDDLSYFLVKRLFGLPLPVTATSYALDDLTLVHFSTVFCFAVIVETRFQARGSGCRVTSIYDVGGPRLLRWCLPLALRLIERNHGKLMRKDLPMRARRAQLRGWGFRYRYDGGEWPSEATLDLSVSNVVAPEKTGAAVSIALDEVLPKDGEALLGRDDHLGLRLVRRGSRLLVYPRLCPHEGASLDQASCRGETISCPWHGRAFRPAAELALNSSGETRAQTARHDLTLRGGVLKVDSRMRPDA